MDNTLKLKTQPIKKLILTLSAPTILSLLCNSINMAIDRIFVAKGVGTLSLSAITISFGLYLIIQAFSQLIGSGASSSVAIELGKNEIEKADKIIGNSFFLSILIAVVITVLGLLFLTPLLRLYGANIESIVYAKSYSVVMFLGSIFFVLAQSMNNIVRGMGYAKRSFINFTLSIVINIILNAIFIFILNLGVIGSALATVISNLVCAFLALQFLYSNNRLHLKNIKPSKSIIKNIISIGISGFIAQIALSLVSLTFNHIANIYGGNTAVASYGIIYTIFMMVYMALIGLGSGIQPIIGFNYGAKLYLRVKETLKLALKYSTIFCIITFILIETCTYYIVILFASSKDTSLIAMTIQGMKIFGIMLPTVGFQLIGSNFFQYVGKAKQSIFLSALRQIILLIPLTIILPIFFNINGLWISTPVSDFISFIITLILIKKEVSKLNKQLIQK